MQIIIIPALTAFILNMVFTPVIIKVALKKGWVDKINDRKIHTGEIPRLGGIGIFLSFIISFSLFYFVFNNDNSLIFSDYDSQLSDWKIFGFYFSIVAIFVTGLIDDFSDLRARFKLILQLAVALSLVLSGFIFHKLTIPFSDITIKLGWISYPLTFIWFIGIINAVNLIDGMDGLSGGTSFLSLGFLGIIGLVTGNLLMTYLSFILMASLLAFLVFNFPPAKIFMGDSGSLFLGTALAIIPLSGFSKQSDISIAGWELLIIVLIYIVPIFDTLSAIVRRSIIKKIHFFNADKEHLHHKLLEIGLTTKKALAVIYSITISGGLFAFAIAYFTEIRSILLVSSIFFYILVFTAIYLIYKKKKART